MTMNTHKLSRHARRVVVGLATAAVAVVAMPATAGAETYGVIQCGDVYGNGGPARNGVYPATDGSYGFQPQANYGQGGRLTTCEQAPDVPSQGAGMTATLTGQWTQAGATRAIWRWTAAPGTSVQRFGARYYAYGRNFDGVSGTYGDAYIQHAGQADPNYDYRYAGATAVRGSWDGPQTIDKALPGGAASVDFAAACSGVTAGHSCPAGATNIVSMNVLGFQAVVNDDSNPQISNVTGELATSTVWNGTMDVSSQITDQGSGAYRFVFQRRGAGNTWSDVGSQPVSTNGGKCVAVGDAKVFSETRVFAHAQPCRTNASGDFAVDTSQIAEGTDTYRVLVEDAAGNRSTLIGASPRTVDRTAPSIDWNSVAKTCVAGSRIGVWPTVVDAGSGVDSIVVTVKDKDGVVIPVAADGTIECPAAGRGPLSMSIVVTDKAGNSASDSRSSTVTVTSAPNVTPPPSGSGETIKPTPSTPTPTPGGNSPVVTVPKTAATSNLLQCTKKGLVLTEVLPAGRRDAIRGVADPKYVGRSVSIRYLATGKTIASTPIGIDGTFAVNVPAAKGKAARGNKGRYQAVIDGEKSVALKRVRRMYTVNVYRAAGGGVYVNGRVTKPFKSGTKVTVQVRRSCGKWNSAKTVRVNGKGAFGALIAVNPADSSVVVRAISRVQKAAKSKRTSGTATLPSAVQLR